MLALAQREKDRNRAENKPAANLTPLETEIIEFFVQLARSMGLPGSVAEIYGLLFISAQSLTLDDLVERLSMSRGGVSQGLAFLRRVGAVRVVYVPGDRRMRYEAVAELRNMVARFVQEQILPHLETGRQRLGRMDRLVKQLPAAERTRAGRRVKLLQSWERNVRFFLPAMVKILGK